MDAEKINEMIDKILQSYVDDKTPFTIYEIYLNLNSEYKCFYSDVRDTIKERTLNISGYEQTLCDMGTRNSNKPVKALVYHYAGRSPHSYTPLTESAIAMLKRGKVLEVSTKELPPKEEVNDVSNLVPIKIERNSLGAHCIPKSLIDQIGIEPFKLCYVYSSNQLIEICKYQKKDDFTGTPTLVSTDGSVNIPNFVFLAALQDRADDVEYISKHIKIDTNQCIIRIGS